MLNKFHLPCRWFPASESQSVYCCTKSELNKNIDYLFVLYSLKTSFHRSSRLSEECRKDHHQTICWTPFLLPSQSRHHHIISLLITLFLQVSIIYISNFLIIIFSIFAALLGVNQQLAMANPGHTGPMQGRPTQGNNQVSLSM